MIINLETSQAEKLALIMKAWISDYEDGSFHLQQILEGNLPNESGWDDDTLNRYIQSNDQAIELLQDIVDQIGVPITR